MNLRKFWLTMLLGAAALAQSGWFENSFCKVQVPTGWAQVESDRTALVRLYTPADANPNGGEKAHIDIEAGTVSGGLGMDMFGYMEKDEAERDYPNMPLKVSKEYKLGRSPGHRFEFVGKHNGKDMTMVEVFTIVGDKSYTVTYLAETSQYKRDSSTLESVLRSFTGR